MNIKITHAKKSRAGIIRVFSSTTLARFEEIAELIKAHEKNIAYLQAIADDCIHLRKKGATAGIRCYQRTRDDEARLPKTLANLRQQIDWLKHEREVLKKYGR